MNGPSLIGITLVLAQSVLATTFVMAAVQKARATEVFAAGLAAFGIPRNLRRAGTRLLIACELVVAALMLSSGITAIIGFALCSTMLIAFSAVLVRSMVSGVPAECNCFGAGSMPISAAELSRNIALFIVAISGGLIAIAFAGSFPSALDSIVAALKGGNPTSLAVATAGVALALVWSQLPQIVALVRLE